jgi:hypothetical protein
VIEVTGFEQVDESVHMLEWLRRGRDVAAFVVEDLENELDLQDPGSQLLSVHCVAAPMLETGLRGEDSSQAAVTRFSAAFPIELRVRRTDGSTWRLQLKYRYEATGMNAPAQFKLVTNFDVTGHDVDS